MGGIGGQDHEAAAGDKFLGPADQLQASPLRHSHVHDGQIRFLLGNQLHSLRAGGGHAHHFHIRFCAEAFLQSLAHHRVVINDNDSHTINSSFSAVVLSWPLGISQETVVPLPGLLSIVRLPPMFLASSFMLSSPRPLLPP